MSVSRGLGRLQYALSLESRQRKLDLFWKVMEPDLGECVLNIGATPPHLGQALTGEQKEGCLEQPEQDPRWKDLSVVGLNIDHDNSKHYAEFYRGTNRSALTGDACRLPFADKTFDIVFSNAVIEHVPSVWQKRMADEIMRVGRSWFITTPNFWYPMEMHHKLPLFQFFPRTVQRAIQLQFHTWPESETIQLLSARRFAALFPGSTLRKLRVTFWPETLILFRRDVRGQSRDLGVMKE
jgi:Methyltransferase domain